jgi:hypothetical protein
MHQADKRCLHQADKRCMHQADKRCMVSHLHRAASTMHVAACRDQPSLLLLPHRGGLDYNLPIDGSDVREKPLHVVHISVEMAPIAKVGGLGDVVTALARAVQDEGHLTELILPK